MSSLRKRGNSSSRFNVVLGLTIICALLLVASTAAYAGVNLLADPTFATTTPGMIVTAPGTTNISSYIRFVNTGGYGKLEVIGADQDGNGRAVKVTVNNGYDPGVTPVQIDLDTNPTASWIPVQAGQKYEMSFWARTDDLTWMQLQVNWRNGWSPVCSEYPGWALTQTWTKYSCAYTAPSGIDLLQLAWLVGAPGTIIIDNISVQAVPEPGSMLAVLSGIVGLVGFGIRRRK